MLPQIVDARTGVRIGRPVWGWFYGWSPDSRVFATVADDSDCGPAVLIYRASDAEYLFCATETRDVAFNPDSTALAYLEKRFDVPPRNAGEAAYASNDVYLMDLEDGSERLLLRDVQGFLCPHWSPDGRWLFVSQCGGL